MNAALLLLAIASADVGTAPPDAMTAPEATVAIAPLAKPGTLIFSKGQCVYVTAYTGSEITHVAIVCPDADGNRWVYDSMKGHGVRRSRLADYLVSMKDAELTLVPPAGPMSPAQLGGLRRTLEEDLGRPYDVAHYLTGVESDGLHCSEYVTESLADVGVLRSRRPADVSPGQLADGVALMRFFAEPTRVQLTVPEPAKPTGMGCCEEFWWDTKACCRSTGDWLSGLFLCR